MPSSSLAKEAIQVVISIALGGAVVLAIHLPRSLQRAVARRRVRTQTHDKLVVVTGCDSGFGRGLVEELLASTEFHVLALTLTDKAKDELTELAKSNNDKNNNADESKTVTESENEGTADDRDETGTSRRLLAQKCDVTSDEDIQEMKQTVLELLEKNTNLQLYGIVNNAGIIDGVGPNLVHATPDRMIRTMNVNYFGMLRVVCALQETLVAADCNGRIINLSSTAGVICTGYNSAYEASKHAVEGWSNSLAIELSPMGVHVVKIRPSGYGTNIMDKMSPFMMDNIKSAPAHIQEAIGGDAIRESLDGLSQVEHGDPKEVVELLRDVLLDPSPRLCYWVGDAAKTFFRALEALPQQVRFDAFRFMYDRTVPTKKLRKVKQAE